MSETIASKEPKGNVPPNTLYIMVGLPRSGKTSWARDKDMPIVSTDAIRLALHGKAFIPSAEDFVWATARLMVASLFGAGHNAVVIDSCNHLLMHRNKWYVPDGRKVFVQATTPMSVCYERNNKHPDPEHREAMAIVIERMDATFEPVTESELGDWDMVKTLKDEI